MTTQTKVYVIDRFEGEWAVLEVAAGETFNVPGAWLPGDAEEGDVLTPTLETGPGESAARFAVDVAETARRREQVRALRASLPRAPGGDLEL